MLLLAMLSGCAGPVGPAGRPGEDLWLVLEQDTTWDGDHDVRGVVEIPAGITLSVSGVVRIHPASLLLARGALVASPGTSFETTDLGALGEQVIVAGTGSMLDGVHVVGLPLRVEGDGLPGLSGVVFDDGALEVRDRDAPFTLADTTFAGTGAVALELRGTGPVTVRDVAIDGYATAISGSLPRTGSELALERVDLGDGQVGVQLVGPWAVDLDAVTAHDLAAGGLQLGAATGRIAASTVTDVGVGSGIQADATSRLTVVGVTVQRTGGTGIAALGPQTTIDDTTVEDVAGSGVVVGDDAALAGVVVRRTRADCVQGGDRVQVLGLLAEDCGSYGLSVRADLDATDVTVLRGASGISATTRASITTARVEDTRIGDGVRIEDGAVSGATILRPGGSGLYARGDVGVADSVVEDAYGSGLSASGALTATDVVVRRSGSHGVVGTGVVLTRARIEAPNGYGVIAYSGLTASCVVVATVRDHGLYATGHAAVVDASVTDAGGTAIYVQSADLTRVTVERTGSTGVYLYDDLAPSTVQASVIRDAGYIGLQGTGVSTQVLGSDVVGSTSWGLYSLGPVSGSYIADNNGAVGPEPVEVGGIDAVGDASTAQSVYLDALLAPSLVPVAPGFDSACGPPG